PFECELRLQSAYRGSAQDESLRTQLDCATLISQVCRSPKNPVTLRPPTQHTLLEAIIIFLMLSPTDSTRSGGSGTAVAGGGSGTASGGSGTAGGCSGEGDLDLLYEMRDGSVRERECECSVCVYEDDDTQE
ncbi:hypothetical protein Tco_0718805, partial [Tanacetum coccineum]